MIRVHLSIVLFSVTSLCSRTYAKFLNEPCSDNSSCTVYQSYCGKDEKCICPTGYKPSEGKTGCVLELRPEVDPIHCRDDKDCLQIDEYMMCKYDRYCVCKEKHYRIIKLYPGWQCIHFKDIAQASESRLFVKIIPAPLIVLLLFIAYVVIGYQIKLKYMGPSATRDTIVNLRTSRRRFVPLWRGVTFHNTVTGFNSQDLPPAFTEVIVHGEPASEHPETADCDKVRTPPPPYQTVAQEPPPTYEEAIRLQCQQPGSSSKYTPSSVSSREQ